MTDPNLNLTLTLTIPIAPPATNHQHQSTQLLVVTLQVLRRGAGALLSPREQAERPRELLAPGVRAGGGGHLPSDGSGVRGWILEPDCEDARQPLSMARKGGVR